MPRTSVPAGLNEARSHHASLPGFMVTKPCACAAVASAANRAASAMRFMICPGTKTFVAWSLSHVQSRLAENAADPLAESRPTPDDACASSALGFLKQNEETLMKVSDAIADILRKEGVEIVIGY